MCFCELMLGRQIPNVLVLVVELVVALYNGVCWTIFQTQSLFSGSYFLLPLLRVVVCYSYFYSQYLYLLMMLQRGTMGLDECYSHFK